MEKQSKSVVVKRKDVILERVSKGEFLKDIAKDLGITGQAISYQLKDDPAYLAAKEEGISTRLDEASALLDTVTRTAEINEAEGKRSIHDSLSLARIYEMNLKRVEWRASVDLFLTYTSAVGSGGTAATRTGTSLTAATFGAANPKPSELDPGITARLTPSSGATAAALISWNTVFTEETNAGTYLEKDLVRGTSPIPEEILVPKGNGIRVVQGAVASVGNIGFNVQFALV